MVHTDTALAVSPSGLVMWTRDADVIHQVFSRTRSDFQKPIEQMGMLKMYGAPLTASEGDLARHLQRIIIPAFNDTTFQMAWYESLRLCGIMKQSWTQDRKDQTYYVADVNFQMKGITARVLLAALYGMKVDWARELHQNRIPPGHRMSLIEASVVALDAMLPKFLIPEVILGQFFQYRNL